MQRMHQSYKCMKALLMQLSGCASNLLAHEYLGHLRKPIIRICKPSSITKTSHQYMKVTKQETIYHKDHGATLKHKCGKRIVTLPLLSFSFIFFNGFFGLLFFIQASLASFFPLFFLFSFFFYFSSGVSSRLVGESQSPSSFPHQDNALIMMIITLLFTYYSILQLDTRII